MATPRSTHPPAFQKALDEFRSDLAREAEDEFNCTTLEDLQRCILEIQKKHDRKSKNMNRLKTLLEAMEQYGKVVEVCLNTTNVLAFVWVSRQSSLVGTSRLTYAL